MYRLMYNSGVRYVSNRNGVYYYTRRVPYDVNKHYASDRLSFSLKTKSYASAVRAAQSVTQRLEDYWLGLRLQQMDIPAIHLVKTDDVTRHKPIPNDVLKQIQQRYMEANDDPRWLVALIGDTGMRLSEAAGLAIEDILLNEEIPYVDIKQHPWRRLKTSSSQRKLPLVGCSLWAAQQAVNASTSPYLFPSYCDGVTTHSNSASAALNKWLK